jgi:hypothetical protein
MLYGKNPQVKVSENSELRSRHSKWFLAGPANVRSSLIGAWPDAFVSVRLRCYGRAGLKKGKL